jgi:hypothetical protein
LLPIHGTEYEIEYHMFPRSTYTNGIRFLYNPKWI